MPARVPPAAWVALVVVASAAIRFQLSRDLPAPWIFVDELIYSELAKSLAAGGELLVRDVPTAGYGVVYPLLISPAWALHDDVPSAYTTAKLINAVLISLAAVPAYALARRLLAPPLALLAAVLAVALPSLAYSGTLMTENAFYPLALCFVLALTLALERPTLSRQMVLLALLGVAYLTRPQALAFGAAALAAPLLQGLLERRVRAAVSAQRTLYAVAGAALLLVLAAQVGRGRSLSSLLGAYEVVGERSYSVGAAARYLVYHVAELDLYVGVFPLAAAALLVASARATKRALNAFLAASLSTSLATLLLVSVFASRFSARVLERNVFFLVPLVLIAFLAWIERGAPRPARATAAAMVAAAALPGALPFSRLIGDQTIADTLMLLPLASLQEHGLRLVELPALVVPVSIALSMLLFLPLRLLPGLAFLVLAWFAVAASTVDQRFERAAQGARFSGISRGDLDWIDRAVPEGAAVSVLWTGEGDVYDVWQNEFFNRSVGTVFSIGGPVPGGLARTDLAVDPEAGTLRDGNGRPVQPDYVLVDRGFTPAGRVVARDESQGLAVYELDGPLRSPTQISGLYPGDTWSGAEVVYLRRDCRGGRLHVALRSDPSLFEEPQTVVATILGDVVGRVVLDPGESADLAVALTPVDGLCVVEFSVSPTAVPANVTLGANPDTRVLGAHFDRFDYVAP